MFNTNYENILLSISGVFGYFLKSTWRSKSLGLISLLFGYYLSTSLGSYYLNILGGRIFTATLFALIIEFLVRLRPQKLNKVSDLWIVIDNFRIGVSYGLILEAFKLGS